MKGKLETTIAQKDILDAARDAGLFKMFLKAVETAGLDKLLRGEGPVTVFAPVDRAFEKMARPVWERLLGNKKELTDVLSYHIVPGKITIGNIMTLTAVDTLQGQKIRINACDGIAVNKAKVIKADIDGSNGIIHGIDRVLTPPE
jgi:uncharacterized surface protein with fasciclin (FAS1) repeats